MKEFDLEAALNGKPVMLRNGIKAVVKYNLLNEVEKLEVRDAEYPLIGYRFDGIYINTTSWSLTGKSVHWATMKYDIIGMWEEPKISIEDLPKSFQPKKDEIYYYIHPHETNFYLDVHETTSANCRFDEILSDTGNCFRTRKDAQKWIDFMESMKE